MITAWHFVGGALRNGDPTPADGKWLEYKGPLRMCESGLHASLDPFDALQYAPGPNLCLVRCGGEIINGDDKLVCYRRLIVARMDATDLLRYFARMQALSVVRLMEPCPPDVVLDYLITGEESIRAAARDAARAAAWDAGWDAAWAAGWDAAWAAARAAARDAGWDAARKDFNALVLDCFADYL